jgi:hypothetical protein
MLGTVSPGEVAIDMDPSRLSSVSFSTLAQNVLKEGFAMLTGVAFNLLGLPLVSTIVYASGSRTKPGILEGSAARRKATERVGREA